MKDYQNIREEFAALCHEQWCGWMVYMFEKGHLNDDESLRLPNKYVERWTRQMIAPYASLPENEKQSDKEEADRFLAILEVDAVLGASDEEISKHADNLDEIERNEFIKRAKYIISSEIKDKEKDS